MADEIRRSGRANKGHHTKNQDALDEPSPAPKAKAPPVAEKKGPTPGKKGQPKGQAQRAQSTQSAEQEEEEEEEEEEDAIIRCVCGDQRDIRGRQMICCDSCTAWQHNKCLGLPEGDFWEGKDYYCEQCRPQDHVDLLAAMARGERPWARKKGSKPKPRASDVKQEVASEKATTPQQSATPSQQPPPAPVEAPTPTPAPAPAPAPASAPAPAAAPTPEASNGHSDSKEGTTSQPQSPLGEKRRHEQVSEKANASKKRRKSSHQEAKQAPQSAPVGDIDALPHNQKAVAEKLCDTLAPLINAASDTRGYRIPDGQTAKSLATKYTLQMSHAAFTLYGEPTGGSSPYFGKMRTIMFNVKKNTVLVDRLLSGNLKAEDLVSMEAEEMASEDKQREYAAMREAAEKQMILTEETGPRLRKTHKGEEIVGEDNFEDDFRRPSLQERESATEDAIAQSPMAVRPPESPATARGPDMDSAQHDGARRASNNFDINSVFDKVRSPQHDQQSFIHRRHSSMHNQDKPQTAVDDADVDRLLKDEDNDVEMSGYSSDPTVCWQGSINMQSMEPFDAVARFVAGGDFGQIVPWEKLLTHVVAIQGRIESAKGNDYIQSIGHTESHEVSILAISPVTTEGRTVMDHLYEYFHSRGRWGVVPVEGADILRDLYVIPIEEGGSNLPPFIDMLEYCTIETPRKEHMLILALVAKLPDVKSQLPPTEHYERYPAQEIASGQTTQPAFSNGPAPSPMTNPHAPQFSPVSAAYPPSQYANPFVPPQANMLGNQQPQQQPPPPPMNVPPHHQIPKALEILGPYIDAPVIVTILSSNLHQNAVVSELQMINLRHIVETVPEARDNIAVLTNHLQSKNDASRQQQQQAQPPATS
ncbi:phd finger domain-containing protein [Stemphylium lycopersici]|uniref:Transcription factor BYE1 n=1 Tax=Stemphylium lycopersici TaxID=183478 RepID=A0A364N8X8_STELY|nr:phd finger domain-containing protein [Stemphylium lycopersici]